MKKSINEVLLIIDIAISISLLLSVILEICLYPKVNPKLLFAVSIASFIAIICLETIIMILFKKIKKSIKKK